MSAPADVFVADRLTLAERERIRYHLGYLATPFAPSIQLGIARPIQTMFLLEDALMLINDKLVCDRLRKLLCIVDGLEKKMAQVACQGELGVEQLGEMQLHPLRDRGMLHTDSLEREYRRWTDRIADILGAPKYAYSTRNQRRGPGTTINTRG